MFIIIFCNNISCPLHDKITSWGSSCPWTWDFYRTLEKQTENSFKDKMNKFTPVLFFCLKNCLKISSWVIFSLKKYLNRISSFCFVWLKRQFWHICRYYLTHSRGLFVSRWPWKMQIWWPFNNSEASRTSVSLPAPSAPLCAPYEMKGPLVTCWSCYSVWTHG